MPNVKKGKSGLEYIPAKDSTITFKCVNYNKSYEEEFDDGLTKRSKNTYVFCDGDLHKFCLMLLKVVYPLIAGNSLMKYNYQQRKTFTERYNDGNH